MIAIGRINRLEVFELVNEGTWLTDGHENVFLPNKNTSDSLELGNEVDVFVFKDNDAQLVATTRFPVAMVGEFAFLQVKALNKAGAFMDWGLAKDVLVPFREQKKEMKENEWYVVYLYLDQVSQRIVGTTKLAPFFHEVDDSLKEGDEVEILIIRDTQLGFEAIIDNKYKGILYKNELFEPIEIGEKRLAYVKKIREDKKIDLTLKARDFGISEEAKAIILKVLERSNGYLDLNDNSDPEEIKEHLHMSKKSFKKAIGGLYKDKRILIEPKGIRLLE